MKTKQHLTLFIFIAIFTSCSILNSKKEPLTKPLFYQTNRIELLTDLKNNNIIFSENTTNQDTVFYQDRDSSRKNNSLSDVQKLQEVTVLSNRKNSFSIIRNGFVEVPFFINVPANLLNEKWRLRIVPNIHINDTTILADPIFLKGPEFFSFQQESYKDFENFNKSIIPLDKYDSAFLDIERVKRDIAIKQSKFYIDYNTRWNKQQKIKNWYKEQERRYEQETTDKRAKLAKQKAFRNLLAKEYVDNEYRKGKDTTGLYNSYMTKIINKLQNFENSVDTMKIPNEYYSLIHGEIVSNEKFTIKDSLDIVQDRYLQDKIVQNEAKINRLEKEENYRIPFPYESDYKVDSVVDGNNNFNYKYVFSYPSDVAIKNLYVTIDSNIDAIDKSSFDVYSNDTIFYTISSLSQLADSNLGYVEHEVKEQGSNDLTLNFIFNNDNTIDKNKNEESISKIEKFFENISIYGYNVDSITIKTYTNIVGDYSSNSQKSIQRANSLKELVSSKFDGKITVEPKAENWQDLYDLVKNSTNISNRSEIADLLLKTKDPDATKKILEKKYTNEYKVIKNDINPLLEKEILVLYMSYPNFSKEDAVKKIERKDYLKGLELLRDKKYEEAYEILYYYKDYNTALCLASLNINEKAKDILEQCPQTSNTEYLLALINIREGNKEDAINHLSKSIKLNPTKKDRIKYDYEINEFVNSNNLTF